MQIINNENIRPFDCDGCLIIHAKDDSGPGPFVDIYDIVTEGHIKVRVNEAMVRLLKEEYCRGGHIIVWSRGGYEWARSIIVALELESYVHQVMSKPLVYFDDVCVSEWLKDRIFIGPDTFYKIKTVSNETKET